MTYRFILKEYNDCAYFDIQVKNKLEFANHMYIRFSSDKCSKIVFKFYKDEICQGGKPINSSIIREIGFFDAGYEHWTEFESFNKSIIYDYHVRDFDIIEIHPLHVGYTHDINNSKILDI